MLIDSLNEYSDSQAVTATAASTNVIDHVNPGDALNHELYLHIKCVESVATATNITFALQTDTVENFASPTTLFTTAAIAIANLTAGTEVVRVRVPAGQARAVVVPRAMSGEPTDNRRPVCRAVRVRELEKP